MLYFVLMSYSPNLPPAVLCSLAVAYFVYFMMGGKVLCDEEQEQPATLAPETSPEVETDLDQRLETTSSEALASAQAPGAIATLPIVHPAGKSDNFYS